jgi:ArsR family transcriptional regulator
MKYGHAEFVPTFKALSDETRLKVLEMLSRGELCACDILEQFHITQPTLSYHMKLLTGCGLVTGRRDGAWMKYTLNAERFAEIQDFWNRYANSSEDCICKE